MTRHRAAFARIAALALAVLPQTLGRRARPVPRDGPTFTLEIVDEDGGRLPEAHFALVDMEKRAPWGPLVVESSLEPVPGVARLALSVLARPGGGPPRRVDAVLQPATADSPRVSLPPDLAADGVVTLRVPRDREWTQRTALVEVVDADGRPLAGVPVSCCALARADGSDLVFDGERLTDERGRVEVRPALSPFFALDEQDVRVVARLPLAEALAAPLGPATDFDAPLRFTIPPHGSVRVALDGDVGARAVVTLIVADRARAGAPDHVGGRCAYAAVESGAALFPVVGLGLELEVELADAASGGRVTRVVRGPTRAGEAVEVRIAPDGSFAPPRVRFRALDSGGRPLAGADVNAISRCKAPAGVLCTTGGSGPNNVTARADADGRVEFPVLRPWNDGHVHWLELRARLPGAPEREWTREARAEASFALAPGTERELRDVVFDTAMFFLVGTVVDDAGAPVARAGVMVWPIAAEESREERRARRARGEPREGPFEGPWSATADDAGRFRVAVTTPTPRLLVEVQRGTASVRREIEADGGELRLELPRTGVFAARVRMDPGFFPDELRFVLRGESGEHWLYWTGIDAFGTPRPFDVREELPVGRYALEVRAGKMFGFAVARLEDVDVAPGEGPLEARLDPLDLRGAVARVTLRLRSPDGAPLGGSLVARAGDQEEEVWTDGEGVLRLLLPRSATTLELEPEGLAPLRVDTRVAEHELRFAPR